MRGSFTQTLLEPNGVQNNIHVEVTTIATVGHQIYYDEIVNMRKTVNTCQGRMKPRWKALEPYKVKLILVSFPQKGGSRSRLRNGNERDNEQV